MASILDKIKGMFGGSKGDGAQGGKVDMDTIKEKAGEVKDKVDDLVEKVGEKVPDKVKDAYGKVSDKVESVIPGKHGSDDAGDTPAAGETPAAADTPAAGDTPAG